MTGLARNTQIEYVAPIDSGFTQSQQQPEPARRNLLQAIWMRRWWVVATVILALIVGVIKCQITPPMYQGVATLVVEQSRPNVIANDPTGVMTGTTNYLFTQVELIKSRKILEPVAAMDEIRTLKT